MLSMKLLQESMGLNRVVECSFVDKDTRVSPITNHEHAESSGGPRDSAVT